MKNRILALLIALCLPVSTAWGVGTCVVSNVTSSQNASSRIPDSQTVIVTLTCTADASAGTFPSIAVPLTGSYPSPYLNIYNLTGYMLYQVGQTPGSTAPTANYSVTITDAKGFAMDLGLLTSNGSATAAQLTAITNSGTLYPVARSSLTVAITGNSVNSAGITLDLIFRTTGPGSASSSGSGTTTHPLTAAASGGAAPGSTFNGSAAVTFDYHSFGAAQAPVLLSCTTSCTVTAAYTIVVCTNACAITPLAPAAANQLCVRNSPGAANAITLAALGAGNYYEKTDHSGYGTANHTVVSGGVATDTSCWAGFDANHYLVWGTAIGTWTD